MLGAFASLALLTVVLGGPAGGAQPSQKTEVLPSPRPPEKVETVAPEPEKLPPTRRRSVNPAEPLPGPQAPYVDLRTGAWQQHALPPVNKAPVDLANLSPICSPPVHHQPLLTRGWVYRLGRAWRDTWRKETWHGASCETGGSTQTAAGDGSPAPLMPASPQPSTGTTPNGK